MDEPSNSQFQPFTLSIQYPITDSPPPPFFAGHPLGATGIAQACELTWQLRGWANNRLVSLSSSSSAALQHNLGLGGAVVVSVYKRADGRPNTKVEDSVVARKTGLGYNPATAARGFTVKQAEKVRSQSRKSEWALQNTARKVEARF